MASAKKCDRCGNFFQDSHSTMVGLTTSSDIVRTIWFDYAPNCCLDLCPDCVESFNHWWANETVIPVAKKRGKKDGTDRKTT